MSKDSKIAAKPTNQKEIASSPNSDSATSRKRLGGTFDEKQKDKPPEYRYVQGEEPEIYSVSSYGRGRMGTVFE